MTVPASPNRSLLIRTASSLRPLLDEIVFIGGQTAELLLTDTGSIKVRATIDVDIIVSVSTRTAYSGFEAKLRILGFEPDRREGAPICRSISTDGLVLDTMPLDEAILGFGNSWYSFAVESATRVQLQPDLMIRAISAPAFLATKWEAFGARGKDDPLMSPDLEDIVMVIAGRASIVQEIKQCRHDARKFISSNVRKFMNNRWAEEIVDNAVRDIRRIPELRSEIITRFATIASL